MMVVWFVLILRIKIILEQLISNVTRKSDSDEISKLQKALGMEEEDIDGKWGTKTEEALEKYLMKEEK